MSECPRSGFAALELEPHHDDPLLLSRDVVQIMQMLQLYQAEIARILGLHCGDVAALAQARTRLEPGTPAWERARLLVRGYRALYRQCDGDGQAMYHWLHRELPGFAATPHRLLVDEHALAAVVDHLER
jgi:hypothetical protein